MAQFLSSSSGVKQIPVITAQVVLDPSLSRHVFFTGGYRKEVWCYLDMIGQTCTNQRKATLSTNQSWPRGKYTSSNGSLPHFSSTRPITEAYLRNLLSRDGKCRLPAKRSRNYHFCAHLMTTLTPTKIHVLDTRPRRSAAWQPYLTLV